MAKKRTRSPSDSEEEGSEEDTKISSKSKKIQKKPKATKKKAGGKEALSHGYTKEQQEKFDKYVEQYKKKSNDDLKAILRANDQAANGTKPELAAKCADGKLLGKIPRCPNCDGGRPKFDSTTGVYKCPGYRDDDEMRWCNKKYATDEITREEWKEDDAAGSDEESEEDTKKKKPAAKKSAAKEDKKAAKGGYTTDEQEEYDEYLEQYKQKSNDELKNMLKVNDQATTGTKAELAAKCADGKVLGKIPRCPKCDGGRPKYDPKTRTYKCPGYRDDEEMKWCNKKFTFDELEREEWFDEEDD